MLSGSVSQDGLEGLSEHRLLGPTPGESSVSVGWGRCPEFLFLTSFLIDADSIGLGTMS